MNTCPAVKADGHVCGKRIAADAIRCGGHMSVLLRNGPHQTARNELAHRHKAVSKEFWANAEVQINFETNVIIRERLVEDFEHQFNILKIEHNRQKNMLIREQEDEIRETGIDPDAPARARREEDRRRRRENVQLRWQQEIVEERLDAAEQLRNRIANRVNNVNQIVRNVEVENRPVVGELARFANDNQNVHTTAAVQQTKDMVARLLAIPVPPEYRWNMLECSKTPGDIIMCCKLTPRGAWQMSAKYCQNETIYDLGEGIYGKVLDGVWQFILRSPDKPDLCRILKQEMEDNIGMCAQGNLTRLCNILAGYMEGIGPQESPAEILGRKLPLLMGVEDENDRLKLAYNLLVDLKIPESHWLFWVEPLVEGSVQLKSSGAGEIIGFEIVA
jgi:hypothetical protein